MCSLAVFAITVLAAAVLPGQTPAAKYTFEVASVKHLGNAANLAGGEGEAHSTGMAPPLSGDPGRIDFAAVSLVGVLSRAYNLVPLRIEGPDWLRSERYNIAAKVPDGAPKGHIAEMLQNLLAERFGMAVHWDTREEMGYALAVGKNGPKLKKTEMPEGGAPPDRSMSMTSAGRLEWTASTLDEVALSLSHFLGRPVVDMTGIPGIFDIVLEAAPDSMPGMGSFAAPPGNSPYSSIFTAIHDLGLVLEPRKVPVKRLVVDSAQRIPTPN